MIGRIPPAHAFYGRVTTSHPVERTRATFAENTKRVFTTDDGAGVDIWRVTIGRAK